MVLKVYLNHFIGKTEHYCMSCTHPFLNINYILDLTLSSLNLIGYFSIRIRFLSTFQIASEVLKESHFLL